MNSVGWIEFFRAWVMEDPPTRVPLTLTALGVLLVLPLVGFAAYMWRMATRVRVERVFPPSGYRVLRKTLPLTGDAAVSQARLLRALAVFLAVAAALLVFQLWRFAMVIGG